MLFFVVLCFRMVILDLKFVEVMFFYKFCGRYERRDIDKEKLFLFINSKWLWKGWFIIIFRKVCFLLIVNFYFYFLFNEFIFR